MEEEITEPKTPRQPKLSINVSLDLLHQLDDLVKQHGPFARRHSLHLVALRIGLAELAAHPTRLLEALGHQQG